MSRVNFKPKNFSLNQETVNKIDELAELLDRPKSNIVKIAVNDFYKKIKLGELNV